MQHITVISSRHIFTTATRLLHFISSCGTALSGCSPLPSTLPHSLCNPCSINSSFHRKVPWQALKSTVELPSHVPFTQAFFLYLLLIRIICPIHLQASIIPILAPVLVTVTCTYMQVLGRPICFSRPTLSLQCSSMYCVSRI